jgi:hypothetical protein
MWSGKEEDYYYCRMSPRRLLLQDVSLGEDYYYRMHSYHVPMVGAADSKLKGMVLQRQKVLTTLNLEFVKHTNMHRNKSIEISENQNSRNSNYWIQSFFLTKYMMVTSTDNSGFECFF